VLNKEELTTYKTKYLQNLIKAVPSQLHSDYRLDLGGYPLTPYLDNEIVFKSQLDEIETGAAYLEGTYDLKPIGEDSQFALKVFYPSFEPAEDSEVLHVVRYSECSASLRVESADLQMTDFLLENNLQAEDVIGFVDTINRRIAPYRAQQVSAMRTLMIYIFIGICIVTIASILFSIYVSYLFAIVVVALYFTGLYFVAKKTSK
jgi:hypothetical protein